MKNLTLGLSIFSCTFLMSISQAQEQNTTENSVSTRTLPIRTAQISSRTNTTMERHYRDGHTETITPSRTGTRTYIQSPLKYGSRTVTEIPSKHGTHTVIQTYSKDGTHTTERYTKPIITRADGTRPISRSSYDIGRISTSRINPHSSYRYSSVFTDNHAWILKQITELTNAVSTRSRALGLNLDLSFYSVSYPTSPYVYETYRQLDFLNQALTIYEKVKDHQDQGSAENRATVYLADLIPRVLITSTNEMTGSETSQPYIATNGKITLQTLNDDSNGDLTKTEVLDAYLDTINVDPDHSISKKLKKLLKDN